MLGIGREKDFPNDTGKVLLAKNAKSGEEIYYIPSDEEELPLQKIRGNVFDLIPGERFHKLVKKWNLKRGESQMIRDFFSQRSEDILDLGDSDNYRLRSAFHEIERTLIWYLKNIYHKKGARLEPHFSGQVFDNGSTNNLAVIGASGSGKSTKICKLLTMPQFSGHMLYIFSATPTDPVFKILRDGRRKKLTKFIDIDLIDRELTIDMFRQKNKKPAVIYVDDVLMHCPSAPGRRNLLSGTG